VTACDQHRTAALTPRLTIVMPLKGRRLFTFRFLWYANKRRLPYHFIIADGQVNEAATRRLENSRETFPHLDIEYIRYPDDTDYGRYFAKMSDAMQRVRTPYVMHADNDDFLGFNGIERALDFLDANPDYVCARGHQITFSVHSKIGGSPGSISGRFNKLYWDNDFTDVRAPSAAERLREGGLCHRMYYAVYRSAALSRIWREIVEIDFSDLMLHEDFFALRVLTLGKTRINTQTVSYYSQAATGISYQPLRDWAAHLLRSRFTSDAHAAIERIAAAAAEADGVSASSIADHVRTILTDRYRSFLTGNYGLPAQLKRKIRVKWPRLANGLQTRPRFSVGRERASILFQLEKAGASPEELHCVVDELVAIESALGPNVLAEYAGPFLPLAHGAGAPEWLSI
jgi:glycosyltransferase domain-containing protein